VLRRFPPQSFGGGEVSAYVLAKHLVRRGLKVTVVTGRSGRTMPEEDEMDGIRVLREIQVPNDPNDQQSWNRSTLDTLGRLALEHDVLHVQDPRLIPGCLKHSAASKKPAVATINDLSMTCYYSLHFRDGHRCDVCTLGGLYRCMKEWGGNPAGLFYLYPMQKMFSPGKLNSLSGLLCRSKDVIDILGKNGVKVPMRFSPPPVEDWGYMGDPPLSRTLLYIGRVDRGKGIDTAIRALALADGIKLRVVGTGPYSDEYRALAARQDVLGRVDFAGPVEHDAIARSYASADATVLATTRVEPMPRIIFESCYSGRAIIVSDTTGGSEYVEDGNTGFVVRSGDVEELAEAFTYIYRYKGPVKMGKAARRSIRRKYSLESVVDGVVAFYDEVGRPAVRKDGKPAA